MTALWIFYLTFISAGFFDFLFPHHSSPMKEAVKHVIFWRFNVGQVCCFFLNFNCSQYCPPCFHWFTHVVHIALLLRPLMPWLPASHRLHSVFVVLSFVSNIIPKPGFLAFGQRCFISSQHACLWWCWWRRTYQRHCVVRPPTSSCPLQRFAFDSFFESKSEHCAVSLHHHVGKGSHLGVLLFILLIFPSHVFFCVFRRLNDA